VRSCPKWPVAGSDGTACFRQPGDRYGRLLRYVVRVSDGVNVNIRLVTIGAAAPYFYDGRRGRYATLLEARARRARARKRRLWGACPHTRYNPYAAIATRR
jgi:endonuclease YncB( thermonuclease family)